MAGKKKTPRARARRLKDSYAGKLAALRKLTDEFNAKKWERVKFSRPRTDAGKLARRRALAKVASTYRRAKPYLSKAYKWVRPANKKNLETLRVYAGVPRFKRLRAIPVATQAKRLSVRFGRDGRPNIKEDGVAQRLFLFPTMPRPHTVPGPLGVAKFIDAQDHAVAMLEAMLPEMPQGFYIFYTKHHFLIPETHERDQLVSELRRFYSAYGSSPEFLKLLSGFKWLTDSEEEWFQIKRELSSERERLKGVRKRARLGRALKEVLAMDKILKGGGRLTPTQKKRRGKLSKRVLVKGRR